MRSLGICRVCLRWRRGGPRCGSAVRRVEVIARDFQDVPANERQRMIADNAAELYGIG